MIQKSPDFGHKWAQGTRAAQPPPLITGDRERFQVRKDLTDNLIHFIRFDSDKGPYKTLSQILREHRLVGGTGHIRGGYQCVCFTELSFRLYAHSGFVNPRGLSRYSPFGIMVPKDWLFERGGRPVIYQTD